jgi:uncharacterized membrane protein YidH (DUF202 family)
VPARDPAVQPERTSLAWRRTSLAFVVVALLAWRDASMIHEPGIVYAAAALISLAWLLFLLVKRRRTRALRSRRPAPLDQPTVLLTGTVLLAAVLGGLALVLLHR